MSDGEEVQILDDPIIGSSKSGPSLFPPGHHRSAQSVDFSSFACNHDDKKESFERSVMKMKGNLETLKGLLSEMHLFLLTGEDMLYYMEQYKLMSAKLDEDNKKLDGKLQRLLDGTDDGENMQAILEIKQVYDDDHVKLDAINSTIDDIVFEGNQNLRSSIDHMKTVKTTLEEQLALKTIFTTLREGLSIFRGMKEQANTMHEMVGTQRTSRTRSSNSSRQTKLDSFTNLAESKSQTKPSPHARRQTQEAKMDSYFSATEDPKEAEPSYADFFQDAPKSSSSSSKKKKKSELDDFIVDSDEEIEENNYHNRRLDVSLESGFETFDTLKYLETKDTRNVGSASYLDESISNESSEEEIAKSRKRKAKKKQEDDEEWLDAGEKKVETEDEDFEQVKRSSSKRRKSTESSKTPPIATREARSSSKSGNEVIDLS